MRAHDTAWIVAVLITALSGAASSVSAQDHFASYEQDRQIASGSSYQVAGRICPPPCGISSSADTSAQDGVSECLVETKANASSPYQLGHVWVFPNITGDLCLTFSGSVTDSEGFQFQYRLFNVGEEGEAFDYTPIQGAVLGAASGSLPPQTCPIVTVGTPMDLHILITDTSGSGDTTRSRVLIDLLKIIVGGCLQCA
jgi:hypothetical protein